MRPMPTDAGTRPAEGPSSVASTPGSGAGEETGAWSSPGGGPETGPVPPGVPEPSPGARPAFARKSREDHELESLLRRRLLVISLLGASVFALFFLQNLAASGPVRVHFGRWGLPLSVASAACMLGLAVLLKARRVADLARLRAVELASFGLFMLYFSLWRYTDLAGVASRPFEGPGHRLETIKSENVLNNFVWFATIILYGLLIPNTLRRSLMVVVAMVLTPLAITATGLGIDGVRPWAIPMLLGSIPALLSAAAIAVFGSFKLTRLQEEVKLAREELRELGQYRLVRRLGGGGMGEVYLAEHRLLKRPCAVKFIRGDLVVSAAHVARFEREVRAMSRLTHFNTVEVYDYGHADDGTFYYVMEYLPGLDLERVVEDHGPLGPGRVVHILGQVCAALREAHGIGLIHRDIKPSNILLTSRGGERDVVKLLDFGLVQVVGGDEGGGRITQAGIIMGTPGYMAPEQAAGERLVDGRSDIFSLGAVGYYLLAGRPPFVGESLMKVISLHITATPPPLAEVRPDVPADLAAVIGRCLAREPSDRFERAEQVDAALDRCACAGGWSQDEASAWWRRAEPAMEPEGSADPTRPGDVAPIDPRDPP